MPPPFHGQVFGLVTEGCAPPILTFTVTYAASTQNVNTIAKDIYEPYEPPYSGECNMHPQGNGRQNPVPTSRRLLAISPTARRLQGHVDTMTCYRRTVVLSSVAIVPDTKCRMVRNNLLCSLSFDETVTNGLTTPRAKDSSLGEIRGWLPPAPRTEAQQQSSIATLQGTGIYAAVAGGYVTLTSKYAAAILTCASGAFKWAGYTTATPGAPSALP